MNIALLLDNWYLSNKRQLPWRQSHNPYFIWLSEVILQQTRVAQGTNYYLSFVATYPTLKSLAHANLTDVLKLWEGLGYYSRARNLHAGANQILTKYNGQMPQTYAELLKIKGIGPYTAAAISSICYGEKKAVVDGNVYRVLSRVYGIFTPINSSAGTKEFAILAENLLKLAPNPGQYNQAIMEFGALQCTPKNPNCNSCILAHACRAHLQNMVSQLPVKLKSKPVKHRYLNYLVIFSGSKIAIQQRPPGDIWQDLYEMPMIESAEKLETAEALNLIAPQISTSETTLMHSQLHKLTHQLLHISFWQTAFYDTHSNLNFIEISKLEAFPFPIVIKNFIVQNLLHLPPAK